MKKIILVFALLFYLQLSAQEKKEFLLDENDKEISESEFKRQIAIPDHFYTYSIYKNSNGLYARLVRRKEYGTISKDDIATIREELKRLTGKSIDSTQTIVINFFFTENTGNKRLSIDFNSSNKKYKRFFKRNPQYAQFFMSEKGLKHTTDYVYEDANEVIRKLLFKFPFISNYIIIKPNGHFYRQVSEHHQSEIPDKVKADW